MSPTDRTWAAVRVDGEGQLITANPRTGAHGVEIRTAICNMEAIGRMVRAERDCPPPAGRPTPTRWAVTFSCPRAGGCLPLGADQVEGDWLTAWTLLDLFLLLIFSLAVFGCGDCGGASRLSWRLDLAYHEPGAPRFTWLFLLMPLALLRVVPEGTASGSSLEVHCRRPAAAESGALRGPPDSERDLSATGSRAA